MTANEFRELVATGHLSEAREACAREVNEEILAYYATRPIKPYPYHRSTVMAEAISVAISRLESLRDALRA